MQACPYDALYIDPNTHTAAKCNYCAHRIDVGLEPACVNVCPTQAIISGDLDNPESRISKLKKEQTVSARLIEKGTRPALYYIDADADSLNPLAADSSDSFMWSQQSSGVGHFAHEASGDTEHALERLGRLLSFGETSSRLAKSDAATDSRRARKLLGSLTSEPRRTYDAPQKGILWGWQVSGYLWTKSISAGVIVAVMLARLFSSDFVSQSLEIFATLVGLVFLGLTGGLLVWDLDRPTRFLYVLLRPQWRSWLVRGAYIITAYSFLLVVNLGLVKFAENSWPHRLLVIPLLVTALLTAVYTAFLFAQARGREFWQSRTVPLHMVTHAIICGSAFLGLFAWNWNTEFCSFLRYLLIITSILHLTMTLFDMFLPHADRETAAVVASIVNGRYRRLFWLVSVLTGVLVPVAFMFWLPNNLIFIPSFLFLLGVFASQHIWVRAPQQIPLS